MLKESKKTDANDEVEDDKGDNDEETTQESNWRRAGQDWDDEKEMESVLEKLNH